MPARVVSISDLQPTDTLREESVSYLAALSLEEIEARHGIPQVWETSSGLLVSDGNQRLATTAKRGKMQVLVDYCRPGKIPAGESEFIDLIIERAEQLRKKGVYTPLDLWQA